MTMVKAVGFDLDDTLIMSEKEKIKIMAEIFCSKYNIPGAGKEYKDLFGKSYNRDQKINMIYKIHFGKFPSKKEHNELSRLFSKEYKKRLNTCPLFQCSNIIEELNKQVKCLFLISLENQKDIRQVAKHCGIIRSFKEILGGPASKVKNLQKILKKYKLKPEEVAYIGDSQGDLEATKKLGVRFIGVNKDFKYQKFLKKMGAHFVFSNLCKIPRSVLKR